MTLPAVLPSLTRTGMTMSSKTSRSSPKRPRRRIHWSQVLFMALGLLVVVAFILSMVS